MLSLVPLPHPFHNLTTLGHLLFYAGINASYGVFDLLLNCGRPCCSSCLKCIFNKVCLPKSSESFKELTTINLAKNLCLAFLTYGDTHNRTNTFLEPFMESTQASWSKTRGHPVEF